jgi:hypothetical protein
MYVEFDTEDCLTDTEEYINKFSAVCNKFSIKCINDARKKLNYIKMNCKHNNKEYFDDTIILSNIIREYENNAELSKNKWIYTVFKHGINIIYYQLADKLDKHIQNFTVDIIVSSKDCSYPLTECKTRIIVNDIEKFEKVLIYAADILGFQHINDIPNCYVFRKYMTFIKK